MTLGASSAVIPDIWKNALSLCAAGWGWILLTQWGNSESAFFGVRVDNKFEDGPEAQEIFSRYLLEIITLTIALVFVSTLQQWLFQRQLPSTYIYEFLCLEVLQALGVRIAYWKARNRTLPFAAPVQTMQIADFASLNPPSLIWNLFYWPAVYLPLISISALAIYLHYHWTIFPLPYAITFPVSESSPPIAWSLSVLVRAYWSVIAAILLDVAGVLVALGFSFHIRVNEWGDDDAERWSYRKLLMIITAAATWILTAIVIVVQLQLPLLPKRMDTGIEQFWMISVVAFIVFLPATNFFLLFLLYNKRPVGAVNRSRDDCWKFGLYYFNPRDQVWIVPTRFGAWPVLNLGRPVAWIIILISVASLGVRWYGKSPLAHDPEHASLESQFALATLQLRGGNSEGSDHLIRMARHNNDPAIWTSVAYELTANHSRPRLAREWAEKAVAAEESLNSQSRLAFTFPGDWRMMAALAASWSNLGYVCSWKGDLDCAQKYLAAAWTLDPLPAYNNELAVVLKTVPRPLDSILTCLKLQNGIPVRQAVNISVPGSKDGTAYFDVLLSQTQPPTIQWSRGDKTLSGAAEIILPTLTFPWPDDNGSEKVRLREKLTCAGVDSTCELMALSPAEAQTIRPDLPH
jgi:uncharacterized membrane protein